MKIDKIYLKKVVKKVLIYTLTACLIAIGISAINIYYPKIGQSFDNKIKDYMFQFRGKQQDSKNIVIIDIDEKSLSMLGQWPWSRDKLAKILENLTNAGVLIIGMDIVFAEEDRSSPINILKELNINKKNVADFDKQFNEMVAKTPTILGYKFVIDKNTFIQKRFLDVPLIIVEQNKEAGVDKLLEANGAILNHEKLQDSAYSSGFFNSTPDDSGVIRNIPLVIKYDDQVYPSLDLEIIRIISAVDKIFINYSTLGVESIQVKDIKIPTDKHGRLLLNYKGKSRTFKYISAYDIYNNSFNIEDVKNKIALMGTTATGLNDLKATPFDSLYPGVEIHATTLDNILTQDFIQIPIWIDGFNVINIFFFCIIAMLLIAFTPFWFNPIALFFLLLISTYFSYDALFTQGIMLNTLLPFISILISTFIAIFINYIFEIRNKKMIKEKFASKISQDVMDTLLENDSKELFKPTQKEVTIFFSNIKDFTLILETLDNADTLIDLLNTYLNPMTTIIMKSQGTVDKYIGDSIMAHWNAIGDVENHSQKAVDTAMEQLFLINKLNIKLRNDIKYQQLLTKSRNYSIINIGIGINTGKALVGEVGSEQRSDYTIFGDTINTCEKIMNLSTHYDTRIMISDATKKNLTKDYIFRFLDHVIVKGKTKAIQIWQIYDYSEGDNIFKLYGVSKEQLEEELLLYHRALLLYQDGFFDKALEIFEEVAESEEKTNDNIYKIYIQRCKYYIKHPPKFFTGVFKYE